MLTRVQYPLSLNSITLDESGQVAAEQGGFSAFIVPYIFSLLLIMAIFTSSGFLMQGLGEEKENRVMEILLSSVSPRQLITGKVIGLGTAGLLQILVWLVSARFLAEMASSSIGGLLSNLQIPADFLILSLVYFVLGYLLFAIAMAGAGSIGSTARESQQLGMIFIFPAVNCIRFHRYYLKKRSIQVACGKAGFAENFAMRSSLYRRVLCQSLMSPGLSSRPDRQYNKP